MSHVPHAFENQIFEHYRTKQKELQEAKKLLQSNGFIVVETKNKIKGEFI